MTRSHPPVDADRPDHELLGPTIIAVRHGYQWLDAAGGWVRCHASESMAAGVIIEVRPDVPRRAVDDDVHYAWWSDPGVVRDLGAAIRRRLYGGLVGGRVRRRIEWVEP